MIQSIIENDHFFVKSLWLAGSRGSAVGIVYRLRSGRSGVRISIPVAVRSKAWVCGRSHTRIVGSNPTGGMDVCVVL